MRRNRPDATTAAKAERNSPQAGAGSEPADSLFNNDAPRQTLVQFLGTDTPRADRDFVPDEPPEILPDEIVLNFATTGLRWHAGELLAKVKALKARGKSRRVWVVGQFVYCMRI